MRRLFLPKADARDYRTLSTLLWDSCVALAAATSKRGIFLYSARGHIPTTSRTSRTEKLRQQLLERAGNVLQPRGPRKLCKHSQRQGHSPAQPPKEQKDDMSLCWVLKAALL